MDVDDFEALYRELRGSSSSQPIVDAKSAFADRDFQTAQSLLAEAYETYKESRSRILRQDVEKQVDAKAPDRDRQVRRLKRKQEKAQELIGKFEEILPQLEKYVERENARTQRAEERAREREKEDSKSVEVPSPSEISSASEVSMQPQQSSSNPGSVEERGDLDRLTVPAAFEKRFAESKGEEQLEVVSEYFGFRPFTESENVPPGSLYLLRESGKSVLIIAEQDPLNDDQMLCIDYFHPATTVPMTPAMMARLSEDRKLVMLLNK